MTKMKAQTKRVVLGVTGSVAAYKAADLTRGLLEKGFKVSVVMTKDAENFITPLTLSSLSGEAVYRHDFDKENDVWKMHHIALAKEADCVLIAPATANIIAKLTYGLADDLLTSTILGTKAPVLIAPAMNVEMFANKIVQDNCAKLKKFGFSFVDPVKGKLACGDTGVGHLAAEEDIIKAVQRAVK